MFTKNRRFVLAGNIGCGKTTAMHTISAMLRDSMKQEGRDFLMYPEPVEAWEPFLHDFYRLRTPQSKMALQMAIDGHHKSVPHDVRARIAHHELTSGATIITERSPREARDVFTREHSPQMMLSVLDDSIQAVQTTTVEAPHGFWTGVTYVYIRMDPIYCKSNILRRGRESESTVSYDYLEMIHNRYEALMDSLPKESVHVVSDYTEAANYIVDNM
jgi:deoxyadenosine/deoxycytidine kinase